MSVFFYQFHLGLLAPKGPVRLEFFIFHIDPEASAHHQLLLAIIHSQHQNRCRTIHLEVCREG